MPYDLTGLANTLGAYARKNTRQIVRNKLYNHLRATPEQPVTLHDVMRYRFMKDQEEFAKATFNVQVREEDGTVVEQTDASVVMTGAIRSIRDFAHTSKFNPYALENNWTDFLQDMQRKFRDQPELADVEFVPWLFDELIGKFVEQMMTVSVINGVYSAGFNYAASWGAAFDGIMQIMQAELDAVAPRLTNVVTTGNITSSNAYASLEAVGNAQPKELRGEDLFLICSLQVAQWYNSDYRTTWPGSNPSIHPMHRRYQLEDSPNVVIVPVPELNGQPTVTILTTANNISLNNDYRSTNLPKDEGSAEGGAADLLGPQMKFQPINVDEIQYKISHGAGISVDNWDEVVVNDVADQTV